MSNRGLKNFKKLNKKKEKKERKKNDHKNSKDMSRTFSGVVVGSVGSLPRRFPLFSFFCLLVSLVSDFCPDTRRAVVDTFSFFRLTCSVSLWGGRDAVNK